MNPLRYAVIEITNKCNLNCAHCASTSGKARDDELSFDEIIALLSDIKVLGGEEITIIGGEALLRDDWYAICKQVHQLGMRLILITNGILFNESTLEKMRRLRPWLIGISVDGASRDSYRRMRGVDRFDHVMHTLHRLEQDGHPHVNAITTFVRDNIEEFDNFASLFENTGITWQVQLANRGGQRFKRETFITRQQFAEFVNKMTHAYLNRPTLQLRHMDDFGYCPIDPALRFLHHTWQGCIAGRAVIGVRSDGDVMGCLSLGDGFSVANIREESLASIWSSKIYFEQFRNKAEYLTGGCRRCPHGPECGAGCTAIAVSATGHMGNNPYCIRQLEMENVVTALVD